MQTPGERNLIPGAATCDDDHHFCCRWYHYCESSWVLATLLAQWEFIYIYIMCRHKNVCFVMARWQLWQQQSYILQFCHQQMKMFLQIPDVQPGLIHSRSVTNRYSCCKGASMANERVNIESLNCSTFNSVRKWGRSEVNCLSQELFWFDTWWIYADLGCDWDRAHKLSS